MKYHIYSIIYLIIYMLIYYIPKRIFFFCFYPVAYALREQAKYIRNNYDFEYAFKQCYDLKRILHYTLKPKPKFIQWLIWFALDDAPYFHYNKEYNPTKTPSWIPTDFLKSWYWAGFRNNAVNLSRYFAIINLDYIQCGKYLYLRYFDDCIFPKPFYMFKYFKIGFKSKNIFSCRIRRGG